MKPHQILFSFLVLLAFSCTTPKTDQSQGPDSLGATNSINDSLVPSTVTTPTTPADSNTETLVLQWDEINMSEYGPSYVFKDKNENHVFIQFIETPGFEFQKNDYFDAVYSDDSMFPTITLRPEVVGQWYRATIKNELRELVGAEAEVSIITALEPVRN
jgi:disulfide oxidoreductase YuzD